MEILAVIIVGIFFGVGLLAHNSSVKAKREAQRLAAEEAAYRKRLEQDEQRRRLKQEEARRREAERRQEHLHSIKESIIASVFAAIEAIIINQEIMESQNKVVHIVASTFEASSVAESSVGREQTNAGNLDDARQSSFQTSIIRSNNKATYAAREAAKLEPSLRRKIIQDARIEAIERTIRIAVKDANAELRGNDKYKTITFRRRSALNSDDKIQIKRIAHEIVKYREEEIEKTRNCEKDRLEAIIDAIEPRNNTYARFATSIASRGRKDAIKETRQRLSEDTIKSIIEKPIQFISQDSQKQVELEEAPIAVIMAALSTFVIDKIEDAIEEAVALTIMRTGMLGDLVEPPIANSISITTDDIIHSNTATDLEGPDEIATLGELIHGIDEVNKLGELDDELGLKLNLPIEGFESLPKLERPAGYVYVIQDISHTRQFKIGHTNHPRTRLNRFGVELPIRTEIIAILKSDDSHGLERELHDRYARFSTNGEWFELTEEHIEGILNM